MTDRVEAHPRNRRENLSIDFLILFFMGGIIVFYGFADWDIPIWNYIYYVWNKTEDTVAFACIYLIAPTRYKNLIAPVLMFCIARMLWEILALLLGQDVNSILLTDYMFALTVLIVSVLYARKWLGL